MRPAVRWISMRSGAFISLLRKSLWKIQQEFAQLRKTFMVKPLVWFHRNPVFRAIKILLVSCLLMIGRRISRNQMDLGLSWALDALNATLKLRRLRGRPKVTLPMHKQASANSELEYSSGSEGVCVQLSPRESRVRMSCMIWNPNQVFRFCKKFGTTQMDAPC